MFIQREIVGLLTGNKKGGFDRYLKAKNLSKYLPEKFKENSLAHSVFTFKQDGREAQGFEATDLIDICMMYINAQANKELEQYNQNDNNYYELSVTGRPSTVST